MAMLLISIAAITITVLLHLDTGISLMDLTRDPAATFNYHPFVGFLSSVGLGFWLASAAISLFSWHYLYRLQQHGSHFLLVMGGLSLFLWMDDTFLLHEFIFPLALHIPQEIVYLGYMFCMLFILLLYSRVILNTSYFIFAFALLLLGLSVAFDIVLPMTEKVTFYEDILKFVGLLFWFGYLLDVCHSALDSLQSP